MVNHLNVKGSLYEVLTLPCLTEECRIVFPEFHILVYLKNNSLTHCLNLPALLHFMWIYYNLLSLIVGYAEGQNIILYSW